MLYAVLHLMVLPVTDVMSKLASNVITIVLYTSAADTEIIKENNSYTHLIESFFNVLYEATS